MTAVAAKGGVEAVITAMRRHEGVVGVAEMGCNALWNIACLGGHSAVVREWGSGRGHGDMRACVPLCVHCTWWAADERLGEAIERRQNV